MSTQVERQSIEWRRSKVAELNSQGYSQPETAKILQVSLGTVNRDLSIIRQQSRKNLQIHIEKTLPDEYQRCLTGLNQVLKTCWYIVNKPGTDDKTKVRYYKGKNKIMEMCMCRCHEHARPSIRDTGPEPIVGIGALKGIEALKGIH